MDRTGRADGGRAAHRFAYSGIRVTSPPIPIGGLVDFLLADFPRRFVARRFTVFFFLVALRFFDPFFDPDFFLRVAIAHLSNCAHGTPAALPSDIITPPRETGA